MACRVIMGGPGGVMAIACGPRRRPAPCSVPGCNRPHAALCDFPISGNGRSGTCDKMLCEVHRVKIGDDLDRCPAHHKWEEARRG